MAVAGLVLGGLVFLGPPPTARADRRRPRRRRPRPRPQCDRLGGAHAVGAPAASPSASAQPSTPRPRQPRRASAATARATRPPPRLDRPTAPGAIRDPTARRSRARRRRDDHCPASTSSRDRRGLDAGRDRRHDRPPRRGAARRSWSSPTSTGPSRRRLPRPRRRPDRAGRAAGAPPARGDRGAAGPGRVRVAILTGRTVAGRRRAGAGRRHRVPRRPRAPVGDARARRHGRAIDRRGRRARASTATPSRRRRSRGASPTSSAARRGCSSSARAPSVAFHVRQADDVPAARAAVLAAIAPSRRATDLGDHGLAPYRGRSVVDLRPRGRRRQARGGRSAHGRDTGPARSSSLGDDLSDADAFDAVDRRARAAGRVLAAGHGRGPRPRSRRPPEILRRADLVRRVVAGGRPPARRARSPARARWAAAPGPVSSGIGAFAAAA